MFLTFVVQIYQGLLYKIMEWRAEGEREVGLTWYCDSYYCLKSTLVQSKEKLQTVREQAKWHVQVRNDQI